MCEEDEHDRSDGVGWGVTPFEWVNTDSGEWLSEPAIRNPELGCVHFGGG